MTRAIACLSIHISWNLMSIQATHRPPSTQMNEMRVAGGRPLLWMIREVAVNRDGQMVQKCR